MLARISLIIAFAGILLTGFAEQSPETLFAAANKAYDGQLYDSSFKLYKAIEDQGFVSAELFQNMGTAAYKLDMVPDAVYYFEKGLKLNPGNDDLRHNLELANQRITDKNDEFTRSGIGNWLSNTVGGNADQWAILAVIMSIFGAVFFTSYLFVKKNWIQKSGLYGSIVSWILTLIFVILAYVQYRVASDSEFAILFEPSIDVRNDPSEAASIAFVLHEGSKLKILDANENWLKISFGDKKVGWVPKKVVKII